MAIFRLEAKIIGRRAKDKAGKAIPGRSVSVVAKAAYRAGDKLHDEQTDKVYNYRSRAQQVVHTEIVAPDEAPSWLRPADDDSDSRIMRERLWNEIERAEKRVDSQLAREFIIALPVELEREQQVGLVRHWCQQEVTSKGFVADFAVHDSKQGNNPHTHVLCTLRPVEGEGFGKKPDMSGKFNGAGGVGSGAKSDLEGWRESWEILCNAALEQAGSDARIDHRSLKDQGIDREPEPKIGVEATAMQKRGVEEDPYRVRDARQVRMENELRSAMREVASADENAANDSDQRPLFARVRAAFAHIVNEARELWHDESSGARRRVEPIGKEPLLDEVAPPPGTVPDPQPVGRNADFEPER